MVNRRSRVFSIYHLPSTIYHLPFTIHGLSFVAVGSRFNYNLPAPGDAPEISSLGRNTNEE
jgi:hypothetical protein